MLDKISKAVEARRREAISLLQDLIRVPSPSREEAEVAQLIVTKMRKAGWDSVEVDELHDVMGSIRGRGGGRSILFNGHIDHVPKGDMEDPYSGKVTDGTPFGVEGEVVYGRAASDMKGAVAAMMMAGNVLKGLGVNLKGDFKVAAVSQEEIGGAGTISTIEEYGFLGDLVVIGEATNMEVALGHRGSTKAEVVVRGRSCHASAPERGVNALHKAVDIISRIRDDLIPRLPDHPLYGMTTLTTTRISVKPDASNVVPEECRFTVDCRYNPDFPTEKLDASLTEVIEAAKKDDPEVDAYVVPREVRRRFSGFYTNPDGFPVVDEAKRAVAEVLGREPTVGTWRFATDGRLYYWKGIPVFGFGPGEERSAHTHLDHVRVEDYMEAIKVYAWLAIRICGVG
jgi:putative selenium metabolism hydrolase